MASNDRRQAVRILVPGPAGRRVLARPNGLAGWALPRIGARSCSAWEPAHEEAATRVVGGPVAPVRRIPDGAGDAWELEILDRVPSVGTTWIAIDEADRLGADAAVVRAWGALPASPPDHLQPGWRRRLAAWLREVGVVATGPATTLRHWELAGVVRVPTEDGPVVVKQAGPGFEREPAVTAALTGLPGAPEVVRADGLRLVTRWAGTRDIADRVMTARTVGRLARTATDRLADLRAAGCRPIDAELGEDPVPGLAAARRTVDGLGLATSIVHGDAHPGNVVVDGDRVTVIDWSDPGIGCPALDLDALIGGGAAASEHAPVVTAWAEGFDSDPAPILAALPHLRLVAVARGVAIARDLRARQPPSAAQFWRDEEAWFSERLDALVTAAERSDTDHG